MFDDDLKRLDFEDYIWFIFAILALLNVFADNLQKKFLRTNLEFYQDKANDTYIFVLIVIFIIYIYFFYRNYRSFIRASDKDKEIFLVRLLGSALLIGGVLCLIYFQNKQINFVGTPSL